MTVSIRTASPSAKPAPCIALLLVNETQWLSAVLTEKAAREKRTMLTTSYTCVVLNIKPEHRGSEADAKKSI